MSAPVLIGPPQQCPLKPFSYDTFKIHKITPPTVKERGDIEIKDYVVLQKPQTQDNRLPPPHTLIMDYTMTHIRFGCSHLHPMGQLTNTRHSDGSPDPDGSKGNVQN